MKLQFPLLLAALLLTSSCGFHLRGSETATISAVKNVVINDAAAAGIGNEVRNLLAASGSTISTDADKAEFTLYLSDQSLNKSVLSVSPVTGKAQEYQLTLTVRMTVTDANQAELLGNQLIRVTRDYAFNDEAVLGSVSEQRVVEQDMTRQVASQIVRRLNAVAGK